MNRRIFYLMVTFAMVLGCLYFGKDSGPFVAALLVMGFIGFER